MNIKVLGISGSARKNGNTAILIRKVLEELNTAGIKTELLQLSDLMIEPCKACWNCCGQKNCIHKKDMFCEVFEKMIAADGIILGSPVYSANISSRMQAFIERAAVVCDMNPGLLTHKVGTAVAVARRGGALQALDTMNHFFLNHDMFVIGSTYWNMAYGQTPGEVMKDQEGMQTMKNLGKNVVYLLKKINGFSNEETI